VNVGDRVQIVHEGAIVMSGKVVDDPVGLRVFEKAYPGRDLVMVELDEPVYANGAFWCAMACFVDKMTRVRD
jgi:hypothetical protein